MSTYLYLQCLDHDPPLSSYGEVGQHLYDIKDVSKMVAQRDAVVTAMGLDAIDWDNHFARNTAWFLYRHPKCHIGIVDQYGIEHSFDMSDPDDTVTP